MLMSVSFAKLCWNLCNLTSSNWIIIYSCKIRCSPNALIACCVGHLIGCRFDLTLNPNRKVSQHTPVWIKLSKDSLQVQLIILVHRPALEHHVTLQTCHSQLQLR